MTTEKIDDADRTDRAPRTTFVSFLLDETGSMEAIKDDTIGGFNEYVKTLQGSDGDILFSLVSFNSSRTRKRYVAEPIAGVAPLTAGDYTPNAMTPLIDAAVKIIKATDESVERRGDEPNVVVVMQTDGQENVSVEYGREDLAVLVKEKEAAGWEFVFLGAGLDAFDAARAAGMAFRADRVMSYARDRSREVFADVASNLAEYAAFGEADALDFRPAQREAAGDEYHARRERKDRGKNRKTGSGRQKKPTSGPDRRASTVEDIEL
jgi:hypothetical protein